MATRASIKWVPERGEIIYVNHNPHVGKEMPGMHPLLVTPPRAFKERTGIVFAFPTRAVGVRIGYRSRGWAPVLTRRPSILDRLVYFLARTHFGHGLGFPRPDVVDEEE